MAKTFIRWMGVFNDVPHLERSLKYEINRRDCVACEHVMAFNGKLRALIPFNYSHVRVGCLVDPQKIYRCFQHACHSYYTEDGKLKNGTSGRGSEPRTAKTMDPAEAWIDASKGSYVIGFVIYGNLERLDGKRRGAVRSLSTKHSLPIYELFKGKLINRGIIPPRGPIPPKEGKRQSNLDVLP